MYAPNSHTPPFQIYGGGGIRVIIEMDERRQFDQPALASLPQVDNSVSRYAVESAVCRGSEKRACCMRLLRPYLEEEITSLMDAKIPSRTLSMETRLIINRMNHSRKRVNEAIFLDKSVRSQTRSF